MNINKVIISALLLVPIMSFSNAFARGAEYHPNEENRGYEGERPEVGGMNRSDYDYVNDRALENKAVNNREINNAENAAGAAAGVSGNEYVPVTTPQPQQAPTIIINTGSGH